MVKVRAAIWGNPNPKLLVPGINRQGICDPTDWKYTSIKLKLPDEIDPKPNVVLIRDEAFQSFEDLLKGMPPMEATIEGRFDPGFLGRDHYRVSGHKEEGSDQQRNEGGRIVLHQISNVVAENAPAIR